jgi:hypothetical protein
VSGTGDSTREAGRCVVAWALTDHQDAAFELEQALHQRGHGVEVEVVGGLVQQQHMGLGPADHGERDARLLPTW